MEAISAATAIVRAVDVGFGNTKYVTACAGGDIRCAVFPSVAYPSARDLSAAPAAERRKTVAVPLIGLFAVCFMRWGRR